MDNGNEKNDVRKWYTGKKTELILMGCFGTMSLAGGFGYAISSSRKADPVAFAEGLVGQPGSDSGAKMARRALGKATLYAFGGFSLVCFALWKWSGASSLPEFRHNMRQKLPVLPKRPIEEQGRNEFESLTELMQHAIDLSEEENRKKAQDIAEKS